MRNLSHNYVSIDLLYLIFYTELKKRDFKVEQYLVRHLVYYG